LQSEPFVHLRNALSRSLSIAVSFRLDAHAMEPRPLRRRALLVRVSDQVGCNELRMNSALPADLIRLAAEELEMAGRTASLPVMCNARANGSRGVLRRQRLSASLLISGGDSAAGTAPFPCSQARRDTGQGRSPWGERVCQVLAFGRPHPAVHHGAVTVRWTGVSGRANRSCTRTWRPASPRGARRVTAAAASQAECRWIAFPLGTDKAAKPATCTEQRSSRTLLPDWCDIHSRYEIFDSVDEGLLRRIFVFR
jgi:hypothetical protein